MASGTWQLEPCSHARVHALAEALALDEVTASVLVRRGLRRARRGAPVPRGSAPRPRPVRARRHARGGRRDRRRGRRGPANLRARRLRRRRDLRDRARRPAAARARRRRGVAPAVAVRGGLRPERGHADAARATKASSSCSRSTAASPRSPRSSTRARSGSRSSSPTTTAPADAFPACPVVAPLKGDYPFAGLCGTGVVWKLAQALLGAGHPFLERHLDVVALATVADVVPLVDENRALALLGLRRLAQTQKPGLRALMRVGARRPGRARRVVDRLPARAADQRVRPALPARGRARAAADRGRARGVRARRGARGAEPRAAGGRGADPARGDRPDRVLAGGPAPPSRRTSSPARAGTRA